MGLRDLVAKAPIGTYDNLTLYRDRIRKGLSETHPLEGVSAAVEAGSALDKRLTLTRVALAGPLALLLKKSKGGESYLIIDGPDFQWVAEVDRDRKTQSKARAFAAQVNTQARK